MQQEEIIDNNKHYWDENADLWFGTTALPTYGVKFVSENDLHFFKDVSGTKRAGIAAAVAIHSNILQIEMRPNYGELTCPINS